MKIILSRKGFDSSNGGIPSPILPDGTLLSFPIPGKFDSLSFDDLNYNGVSFSNILRQLRGKEDKTNHYNCHLDPDIREGLRNVPVPDWKPAFGQINSSQGLLRNQNVAVGDLFLFFGWFRQTEGDVQNGTLHFKKGSPDLNIIYGYLQIGDLTNNQGILKKSYPFHPHSNNHLINAKSNTLYMPSDKLAFSSNYKGYGTFSFDEKRVLTMRGKSRSVWKEIPALMPENLCGNHRNSAKNEGIQYSGIWQEKVLMENKISTNWAKSLFS